MTKLDTLLDTPIERTRFVVVDVETTGMSPDDARMTEIAMFTMQGEKLVDEFSTLINPLVTIPASITRLTGIDNVMVADAPTAREVMPQVVKILKGAVFVAHNAAFDWGFVSDSARRERGIELDNPRVCTVKLSRRLLPSLPSRALDPVTQYLQIRIPERHRASGDAFATAEVFRRFLSMLRHEGEVTTLRQLLEFQNAKRYRRLSE